MGEYAKIIAVNLQHCVATETELNIVEADLKQNAVDSQRSVFSAVPLNYDVRCN